jgi:hypothetical protein
MAHCISATTSTSSQTTSSTYCFYGFTCTIAQHLNKNKALAHEPEPSKGKQVSMSPSSDSSSHSVTSHSIPPKHEPKNITFGDMHPEASSNEDKKYAKEDSQKQGDFISRQWTEEDNLPQKI